MSDASLEEDVAKVLMGEYQVVVVRLPAKTFDFINKTLARVDSLEDAAFGGTLFRSVTKVSSEFSVELVLVNGIEEFQRPFLSITLLFVSESLGTSEPMYAYGTEVIDRLPESIILKSEMVDSDIECHLRIVRETEHDAKDKASGKSTWNESTDHGGQCSRGDECDGGWGKQQHPTDCKCHESHADGDAGDSRTGWDHCQR